MRGPQSGNPVPFPAKRPPAGILRLSGVRTLIIHVSALDGCLPRNLPIFNLSASPFEFHDPISRNFTLFNCSKSDKNFPVFVPCLGVSHYHVYGVYSDVGVDLYPLRSCEKIRDVGFVPQGVFGQKNDVLLSWLKPDCSSVVGLWCIQWYPVDRPSMKEVVQMLEGEGDKLTVPPNPFSGFTIITEEYKW